MKKTIYLCGAINGCTDSECNDWRKQVQQDLAGKFAFLDPMRRDYRGIEDQSVNEIVHGDYADIAASDIVLVAADKPSWGTAMEMHHAFAGGGKFVIAVCGAERVSPWLRYHSHLLVKTLDQAIWRLKAEA
jgi:nucleoside 2-deoxyribosyltransferase